MAMPFTVALIAAAVKILVAVGTIMLLVPMLVWLERKVLSDIQARIGPSRVGPFGLLQTLVDGGKLLMKEGLVPASVDKLLYFAAPVLVMIPALGVAAVIPFGGPVQIGPYIHHLVIADIPVGFLFVLALTSLSVYGIVLSGWSSNNKYSLLGGLRSAAQMVSYELPMGLSVIAGLMIASYAAEGNLFGLSLRQVVDAQAGGLYNWTAFNWRFLVLPGFIAAVFFYIGGLAETNRSPFDLPEAESELIGGYHTEYSGLRWAMFFLGEYAAMLNVSSMTTTLFLGGWRAPYRDDLFFAKYSIPYMLQGVFWFCLKVYLIIIIYIWIRGTLPRLRYDRLMNFTWKFLLPVSLANVLFIASILTIRYPEPPPATLQQALSPALTAPPVGSSLSPSNPFQPGGLSSPFPTAPLNRGRVPGLPPGLNIPARTPAPRGGR